MRKWTGTAGLLFASAVSVCQADPESMAQAYWDEYAKCTSFACQDEVDQKVKTDMNEVYDELYEGLAAKSKETADKLEQTQRLWLKYREMHCDLYEGERSFNSRAGEDCRLGLNVDRVTQLRDL